MGLYIQNGGDVNVLWTKHIAVSNDGVNWSTFPKENCVVSRAETNATKTPLYPVSSGKVQKIVIKDASTERVHIEFDLKNVKTPNTWGTDMNLAISDITTWLGS